MTARQAKIDCINHLADQSHYSHSIETNGKKRLGFEQLEKELRLKAKNLQKSEDRAKAKKNGALSKSSIRQ